jgi:hypothetical protein
MCCLSVLDQEALYQKIAKKTGKMVEIMAIRCVSSAEGLKRIAPSKQYLSGLSN